MHTSRAHSVLVVYGPARLVCKGSVVKLRNKGLALLYVLALEGATRREEVADLLWDHADGAKNLRVELHRLRTRLASIGVSAFPSGQDPLELPPAIDLDLTNRDANTDVLLGLDDLAQGYQAWLERQRSALNQEPETLRVPLRQDQVERVARAVQLPYLLILKGPPGAGRQHFVQALAKRLNMPLYEGATGRGNAVHFLEAQVPEPKRVAQHILKQREGLWALAHSTFSPESELLLRLRNQFPPERTRYLDFEPLPWNEARSHLLPGLPFVEAAHIYIESGGHLGYMTELLRLRPNDGFDGDPPLPQRIRAAYLLEAHHLPDATRTVLDQLSVHPGPLADTLLETLGFTGHLDALEMTGWLRFDGLWTFSDETARRVIYRTLHRGRQRHYHARFAAAFAKVDPQAELTVAFHRAMAGTEVALDTVVTPTNAWGNVLLTRRMFSGSGDLPDRTRVTGGRERALLLERHRRLHSHDGGEWSYWTRQPRDKEPCFAEYALPSEPCLLRLDTRMYTENVFGIGLSGEAYPLGLTFSGGPGPERRAVFVDIPLAEQLADGTLLLPEESSLQVGFACHHRILRIECRADAGIVEFRLQVHMLRQSPDAVDIAYDLRGSPVKVASSTA